MEGLMFRMALAITLSALAFLVPALANAQHGGSHSSQPQVLRPATAPHNPASSSHTPTASQSTSSSTSSSPWSPNDKSSTDAKDATTTDDKTDTKTQSSGKH